MPKTKLRIGWPGNFREIQAEIPAGDPPPWDADSKLSVVGARLPRVEGPDKVTGRAKYTSDMAPAGMLTGGVLRSPHAHARATALDLGPARKLPGVKAALELEREPRYAGQAVAAVAAESPLQAQAALDAIVVTWEVLPHVTDPEEARRPDAPRVLGGRNPNARGGASENAADEAACGRALAAASASVDLTFRTPVVEHTCLESHGSLASWEGDALTVWDSTQAVASVRDGLARGLQVPANSVRVVKEHMGGGFGSKLGMGETALIAARLAKEAGRPVRVLNDRKAEQTTGGNRPSSVQRLRLGADKAGTLSVMWLESSGTGGVGGGAGCSGPFRTLYRAGVMRDEHTDILTNAGRAQAFRAPGHVQGMFALESAIDALAIEAGIDPLEFRLRNDASDLRRAEYAEGARRIATGRSVRRARGRMYRRLRDRWTPRRSRPGSTPA
ncbi:MAG: xanthine dehydrogenase family protein molybdopterin-binding subunit [Candidatus Brocadiae bacterium]|nr:xanthine dehydrogenase family protein molybdopterin-binding subunit [Candidatus Brocadiia bacterium]